ncbi:hypothetical protein PAHAL_2G121100 [Panicum hallii]|uniref:F-box domain-containing protein n=1 Tax=Panicum hallii TaxID=206008 RepID=A0A2T8KNS3_9POAL|nr:uncharacterized protein LOC112881924 [Panicum hallii]PVH63853.1 hypothetical protein PAHAL_2G121100 [Panicum hallii]
MDFSNLKSLNPLPPPPLVSCVRRLLGTLMAAQNPRSRRVSQGGGLPLPADALYEILLRFPARDLCRLCAVCRPWRCLLSDPHFVAAAHAARHPEPPLILAGYNTALQDDGIICDVMDLSGRVVKRVRTTGDDTGGKECVISIEAGLICTSKGTEWSSRLLNLATGAVRALPDPEGLAEEPAAHELDTTYLFADAMLGQVPSTGKYKVLRVLEHFNHHEGKLYEVCAMDRGSNAWWTGKKPVPRTVCLGLWLTVVVNGIVYFFYDEQDQAQDPALDRIASFDIGIEEWRASLRGPLSSIVDADVWPNRRSCTDELTMAALNGCLVVWSIAI